ncbi:hypothetical protein PF002_g8574 [Phytophthora fragariae]|uniref:Uncharacterized protein n=2 Tax=Phytophthora fragariae TaxID=53985 RepID=A0A6A3S7X3_9STRA|nr:hypothetical protein PF007_g11391 [Phytophthora fragariae]KAE9242786.1 hypothetical protein PF002_g8574 [Phytophthora fragariae]
MTTAECWTMTHFIDAVNAAASNFVNVYVPKRSKLFKSSKPVLTELNMRLDSVQQYQMISIDSAKPGVIACKKGTDSEAVDQD